MSHQTCVSAHQCNSIHKCLLIGSYEYQIMLGWATHKQNTLQGCINPKDLLDFEYGASQTKANWGLRRPQKAVEHIDFISSDNEHSKDLRVPNSTARCHPSIVFPSSQWLHACMWPRLQVFTPFWLWAHHSLIPSLSLIPQSLPQTIKKLEEGDNRNCAGC